MSGLPQGWIEEKDNNGRSYFIDTRSPNPQAVWTDPRNSNIPSGNHFAPPPSDNNGGQYQNNDSKNQYQQPQQQQQYNQQQQQQQQYSSPPQSAPQSGLMGTLEGFMHPGQQQNQGAAPAKHGLSTGQMIAGGLGALAVAGIGYEVYEHEENKQGGQHHEGKHHHENEGRRY